MTLSCEQARARIDAPHNLAASDRDALAAHVAGCADCRALAAIEARISPAFAAMRSLTPSPRLTAALMAVPSEDRRRRAFAVLPLAWGSLAAVTLIAVVSWFVRAPGDVARTSERGGGSAPTAAAVAPGAAPSDLVSPRADVDAQASAVRSAVRANRTPSGALAGIAVQRHPVIPPATPSPVPALAMAVPPDAAARARGHGSRRDDARRSAATPNGGDLADGPHITAGTDPNKSRPADPTPLPPVDPPAPTDVSIPATPSTPEGGGGGVGTAEPSETPLPNPPGIQPSPSTPAPTDSPGGRAPIVTPASPTPSATPSPLPPTPSATWTATPSATATSTGSPTATPQPMPTVTPLAAPW